MDFHDLVEEARKAKGKAYAPYSKFRVGAALLMEDGRIVTGVNVENVSYGATCCAERTAIFGAVAGGDRRFLAIAIASDLDTMIFPCGICLQVIMEFKIPIVIVSNKNGMYKEYEAKQLLPYAFTEF